MEIGIELRRGSGRVGCPEGVVERMYCTMAAVMVIVCLFTIHGLVLWNACIRVIVIHTYIQSYIHLYIPFNAGCCHFHSLNYTFSCLTHLCTLSCNPESASYFMFTLLLYRNLARLYFMHYHHPLGSDLNAIHH